ncbi:MAG: AMP-binding protein [Thermodesulfovibrionales bacterium]|nr:AMP-binding protein [Thermodesulfovibrionales bacterium]
MTNDTIKSVFLKTAEKCRDKVAFNYKDQIWKSVTYEKVSSDSKAIASYLINAGINKGDRIAIVSENRPEWCIAYMGIMLAGAIAVPIDAQLNPEAVRNFLTDSETKLVFCSSKTAAAVTEAIIGLEIKKIDFDSPDFKELPAFSQAVQFPDTNPEDIASIIYTSGTTGIPKGVMLTHKNFISDAKAAIGADVISQTDSVLSILPLHHTYPFMCTFLIPIILGASITYSPSLKGTDIISAIKDKGVTILIGVPQLLELIRNGIINKIKQLPFPLSWIMKNILTICGSVRKSMDINIGKIIFKSAHKALGKQFRFFASGGARLDPEVMNGLEAIGFTVLEGYGLTETSPVVAFNPMKRHKAGSVGIPFPSAEIKIISRGDGREADTGEEGEVAIKGPMVMKGYYKNSEATAQVIKEGWFFSGDLGYIDKDGYVFITGRIKEVIVLSSGKNIYPEEIEKEYLKIPLIKEICVIPLSPPLEKGGEGGFGKAESLHAVIFPDLENAKKLKISNIHETLKWDINSISSKLPPYMRIKGFDLYPEPLPRTPLGKLRRFMVKDIIKVKSQKSEVRSEDRRLMSDDTGKRVAGCIKLLLKEDIQIQSTDNLELDLGLDSLNRIELVVGIEKEFSITLPETFASDIQTVGDLVERIKELSQRAESIEQRAETTAKGFSAILSQEPSENEKRAIGIKQGAVEWLIVSAIMSAIKLFFKMFFRLEVKGLENIPDSPFIITPNHCSYLDAFVIASGLPMKMLRNLYFHGFQQYFASRPTAFIARLAHVIPIDPDAYLGKALQLSGYVLRNNKNLCIFPEGGRSYDGNLMEFKKGIGILALEMNVPVVPALIKGSFEALPKGSYKLRFKKITVKIGKPFYPSDLDKLKKPGKKEAYQFFADELREKVKGLSV